MSQIPIETKCRYFEELGCLGTPDPEYSMNFEDIGNGYLYFCKHCGPAAHARYNLIMNALSTRGPQFTEQFEKVLRTIEVEEALEKN